jgi:endonuclease/exonuclease/phosphatase family metal-dependent hydrolase
MKKHSCALSFLVSFSFFAVQQVSAANIKVMTQNQYIGAAIERFLGASDAASFNAALIAALQTVAATKTPERMQALANEISKEQPALVGLQEVDQLQCIDGLQTSGVGCNDPSIAGAFSDHLQLTLKDLHGSYVEAAKVINFNIPGVPFVINGVLAQLSVVDRDVILARKDVSTTAVNFQSLGVCSKPSADGCNYAAAIEVSTLFGVLDIERGFVAVDTTIDGKNYRVVTTHPEIQHPDPTNPASQFFQAAQVAELLQILLNTTPLDRSLVVIGDMNSDPREPDVPGPLPLPPPFNSGIVTPYRQFVEAGFTDVWELRPGNPPGDTCCQAEDLTNRLSILDQRIDMIFSLELPAKVKEVRVVGDSAADKTQPPGSRLWPSDHAGLTGELQFQFLSAQR